MYSEHEVKTALNNLTPEQSQEIEAKLGVHGESKGFGASPAVGGFIDNIKTLLPKFLALIKILQDAGLLKPKS